MQPVRGRLPALILPLGRAVRSWLNFRRVVVRSCEHRNFPSDSVAVSQSLAGVVTPAFDPKLLLERTASQGMSDVPPTAVH